MILLFILVAIFLIIGTIEMSRDITKSKLPIDKAVAVEINYDSINNEENAPMAKYNMLLMDLKEQATKVEVIRKKGNNIVYVIYLKNGETKVVDSKVFYCNCFKI